MRTLRSFLISSPPILTKELELGNLRRNNSNDFVYKDFAEFMGNLIFIFFLSFTSTGDSLTKIVLGLRFNDEIYFYMSRGLIDPAVLEAIPN